MSIPTTRYMNITLPLPRIALGNSWGQAILTAINFIDAHDHTEDSGQAVTSAGIDIQENLSLSSFAVEEVERVTLINNEGGGGTCSLYTDVFELFYKDEDGYEVQLTAGGTVNITGVGGISGDYSSTGASVFYTDSTLSYTIEDSQSDAATIVAGAIDAYGLVTISSTSTLPGTNTLSSLTASSITINTATSNSITSDAYMTGEVSGRGIIPIGGCIQFHSNIPGVGSVPTGFALLNGQTISDVDSPLNGQTLPNLNNSIFIMGSSTSGTSGGANSYTLTTAQLPSHTHTMTHGHTNTFALGSATVASSSHNHNMAHTHIHEYVEFLLTPSARQAYFGLTSSNSSKTSITTSDTNWRETAPNYNFTGGATAFNAYDGPLFGDSFYTTGALSAPSGSGSSAATGSPSATTTVTLSGAVTDFTGSTSSTGSGDSVDNRPSYITSIWLIRIK